MDRHKAMVVSGCVLGAVLLAAVAALVRPKDPACGKLEAKLGVSEEFCQGLAERAAQERCSALSDDPETMGQCIRVIVPAAHSSCMGYLNIQRLKNQVRELCE